ncbi:MAG TPA: nuclear transport factor 2 family protein [Pyrinomonadaceae bacterium]|nr:nuclear transport factor 2 family protein [Pyrinomonadaceae bacterium]
MKRTLFFAVAAVLTAFMLFFAVNAQQAHAVGPQMNKRETKDAADIRAVMDAQAAAWNRGDIEGYMAGYLRSDEIVFISGDAVTRGWQTVLERYKRNYNTREKMGVLAFNDLEIKFIAKDAATAIGRWQLTLASGGAPHGRFTLIFRRTKEGWRIVHDHTSSAQ